MAVAKPGAANVARLASASASVETITQPAARTARQASNAAANDASGRKTDIQARPFDVLLLASNAGGHASPSRVLAAERYQVHIAATPAEAKRLLLQTEAIGIAVLDLQGQAFNGTVVYAELCQCLPRDRELAAIFLAHSPSVNDVVRALRLSAVDMLRSPVQPEHLVDAVGRATSLMERRTMLRDGAAALDRAMAAMTATADDLLHAARTVPPVRAPSAANGSVEFTETLDWRAQHEDTPSLAYTQRQRQRVAAAIKAQALRRDILGAALVDDFACWDMLLDLYEKALASRTVSVSSLCSAASVPPTTALRRIEEMMSSGLITRLRDGTDRRRVLVQLTPAAATRLRFYFDTVGGP